MCKKLKKCVKLKNPDADVRGGGGFGNSDTPGQGEGVVYKSEILADVLCRRPLK